MSLYPTSRPLNEGLQPQSLLTIEIPSEADTSEELRIQDFRYIGSYNWTDDQSNPTIVVPGSPPRWIEKSLPITVPPDTGPHFRDLNGHLFPGQPLLPLIAAVVEQNVQPVVDWKNLDFVTDRNSLRKLLRWVRGTGRDWRIDMELVGNKTIFLNRWEQQTIDQLHGTTYGFGFEKAATRPVLGAAGLSGHARIASYDFEGLKIALQFEVDAYLPNPQEIVADTDVTFDDSIGNTATSDQTSSGANIKKSFGVNVIHEGNADIPNDSIIELATTTRKLDWKERYPQLFFSQTPHHFLAWHDQLQMGTFTRIDRRALDCPLLQAANTRLQPAFKKLRATLEFIQRMVVEHGYQERLTLLCTNKQLKVYERLEQASCLPEEASALFCA